MSAGTDNQLIFKIIANWENENIFNKMRWENGVSTDRRRRLYPYVKPYPKIN
jgi:hypothetical protein